MTPEAFLSPGGWVRHIYPDSPIHSRMHGPAGRISVLPAQILPRQGVYTISLSGRGYDLPDEGVLKEIFEVLPGH